MSKTCEVRSKATVCTSHLPPPNTGNRHPNRNPPRPRSHGGADLVNVIEDEDGEVRLVGIEKGPLDFVAPHVVGGGRKRLGRHHAHKRKLWKKTGARDEETHSEATPPHQQPSEHNTYPSPWPAGRQMPSCPRRPRPRAGTSPSGSGTRYEPRRWTRGRRKGRKVTQGST